MNNPIIIPVYIMPPQHYADRTRYIFQEDFTYTNSTGKKWHFEKGYLSDGHSVPPLLRGIWPNCDKAVIAAIAHDQDCEKAFDYQQRKQADKDYYLNMRDFKIPLWSRGLRWVGVAGFAVYLKVRGKV